MSVMCLEDLVVILEAKETLTNSDRLLVERCLKKVETLDAKFKEHHFTVIDHVRDDEQQLDEEQALMDDHEDKVHVADFTEHLQQLWPVSKAASSCG